jgi:hypothetical protein
LRRSRKKEEKEIEKFFLKQCCSNKRKLCQVSRVKERKRARRELFVVVEAVVEDSGVEVEMLGTSSISKGIRLVLWQRRPRLLPEPPMGVLGG